MNDVTKIVKFLEDFLKFLLKVYYKGFSEAIKNKAKKGGFFGMLLNQAITFNAASSFN